ncbi:hypothetical protein SESBI_47375 [Sesbania bispinosa]|nr:hypothetical protein SESBI_47375 [Sesbania bispinosa]
MKPTEAEDNADDGKDVSLKSDDNKPVEPEENVKGLHHTVSEASVKEGENVDEKVLDLSSEKGGEIVEVSHESLVSDVEWVCKSPNGGFSSTASGWPSFVTISSSDTYSLSEEEKANVAVLHLQHKALEACQKFLVGDAEDDDLRRYYESNHKEGDFYCLVCGGIGKKVWKRFKDCVALLHHSTAILRTKRKRAHRAYARVICKVVGWDIDQLPAIVLKDLDSSLAASRKLLVEPEKPAANSIDNSNGEPDNSVDRPIDN